MQALRIGLASYTCGARRTTERTARKHRKEQVRKVHVLGWVLSARRIKISAKCNAHTCDALSPDSQSKYLLRYAQDRSQIQFTWADAACVDVLVFDFANSLFWKQRVPHSYIRHQQNHPVQDAREVLLPHHMF